MAKKPSLKASFGDALLRAGVVSESAAAAAGQAKTEEAERAAREALERARDSGDPQGIASYFARAPRDETFAQAVARGNAWLDAVLAAGHRQGVLERDLAHCSRAIEVGQPIGAEEIAEIEKGLGFDLPASYKRFLGTIGQATFLNPWWDSTTTPREIVTETRRWVESEHRVLARLLPEGAAEKCVYVCDFHNHDAHYFLSCGQTNALDECPVHLLYHDESELYDGTWGFEAWFSEKVTRTIEEETDRIVKG